MTCIVETGNQMKVMFILLVLRFNMFKRMEIERELLKSVFHSLLENAHKLKDALKELEWHIF